MQGRCPKCNYDLAGLSLDSACPECGHHPSHTDHRRLQHPIFEHIKSIALGIVALFIVTLGCMIAIGANDPTRAMKITLAIAAVPAVAGLMVFWSERRGD